VHGTWVVIDNRGLRYKNRHTEFKVYGVTLIGGNSMQPRTAKLTNWPHYIALNERTTNMDTKKTLKTTKIRMDREDFEQIQYEMKGDPLSSDQSEN